MSLCLQFVWGPSLPSSPTASPDGSLRFLFKPFECEEAGDEEDNEGEGEKVEIFFEDGFDFFSFPAEEAGDDKETGGPADGRGDTEAEEIDGCDAGGNGADLVGKWSKAAGEDNPEGRRKKADKTQDTRPQTKEQKLPIANF